VGRGNRLRLYALPLPLPGGARIVVAGVSLSERDAALDKLDDALFIGVPPALLLATLAAYGLAAAALRPVELMRRRAATISGDEIGARLPLPDSDDEIRRLGETLNRMLDRLEDGLLHERLFVASASHELRTPLAVLRAELEVALRERGGEQQLRGAIGSAIEETDRIVKLAEDLLLLARAADGTLPIDPRPLDLEELLEDLGTRFAPTVSRAGRELTLDRAAVTGTVQGDPDRLMQAVGNLIDNSLRYGAGRITLSAREDGDAVEIHVSDRGAGFSEQFLPQAFDRFTRADPARSRGGVGLGLTIVQTIAHAHGGRAGAGNLASGGADVWLALPATARAAATV
jgi:signal transduction histidine kinase